MALEHLMCNAEISEFKTLQSKKDNTDGVPFIGATVGIWAIGLGVAYLVPHIDSPATHYYLDLIRESSSLVSMATLTATITGAAVLGGYIATKLRKLTLLEEFKLAEYNRRCAGYRDQTEK